MALQTERHLELIDKRWEGDITPHKQINSTRCVKQLMFRCVSSEGCLDLPDVVTSATSTGAAPRCWASTFPGCPTSCSFCMAVVVFVVVVVVVAVVIASARRASASTIPILCSFKAAVLPWCVLVCQ